MGKGQNSDFGILGVIHLIHLELIRVEGGIWYCESSIFEGLGGHVKRLVQSEIEKCKHPAAIRVIWLKQNSICSSYEGLIM